MIAASYFSCTVASQINAQARNNGYSLRLGVPVRTFIRILLLVGVKFGFRRAPVPVGSLPSGRLGYISPPWRADAPGAPVLQSSGGLFSFRKSSGIDVQGMIHYALSMLLIFPCLSYL